VSLGVLERYEMSSLGTPCLSYRFSLWHPGSPYFPVERKARHRGSGQLKLPSFFLHHRALILQHQSNQELSKLVAFATGVFSAPPFREISGLPFGVGRNPFICGWHSGRAASEGRPESGSRKSGSGIKIGSSEKFVG
jgi:hypothetical protein